MSNLKRYEIKTYDTEDGRKTIEVIDYRKTYTLTKGEEELVKIRTSIVVSKSEYPRVLVKLAKKWKVKKEFITEL